MLHEDYAASTSFLDQSRRWHAILLHVRDHDQPVHASVFKISMSIFASVHRDLAPLDHWQQQ